MQHFSKEQLINIIHDTKNMDQNIFFISIFPKEVVDEVWLTWSEQFLDESKPDSFPDFRALLLIAFSSEGSIPSTIRKGDLFYQNHFLPEPKTLLLDFSFLNVPKGVTSQLILALNIEHLIFDTENALRNVFDLDFPLVANQIKSCLFYNISSNYQITALYSSKTIEKLSFANVSGDILPKNLSAMNSLSSLEFRLCELKELPLLNKNNSTLKRLVLNESLNSQVLNLDFVPKSVQELDLSMNKINEIQGLSDLNKLENLNISSCLFASFDLAHLPVSLKRLTLRDNELIAFPLLNKDSVGQLEYLDVSHNYISKLPDEIDALSSLTEFLCSHNYLESLADVSSFWRGLKRLDLRNNKLRKLPGSMKSLTNITYLDLEDNFLSEFSDFYIDSEIGQATIRLRGNSFSNEEKHKLLTLETCNLDL